MVKNILKVFVVLCVFLISVMLNNVYAASVPYVWIVGGETVNDSNSQGTATLTKDGKEVLLKLSNYVGGDLELECYGTGQSGLTFIIELEGDNVINSDDEGIDFDYDGKIKFIGNGSLTINAPTPISYESYKNKLIISPSKNIYTDQEDTEDEEDIDEEKEQIATEQKDTTDEVTEKDNNNIIYIIFGAYALLSLVVIVILISKLSKKEA